MRNTTAIGQEAIKADRNINESTFWKQKVLFLILPGFTQLQNK